MEATKPPPRADTLKVTYRDDRSMVMLVLQHIVKLFGTTLIKPRKSFPPGSPQLDIPSKLHRACEVQERKVEDIYVYDFVSKKASPQQHGEKKHKRIYYFSGGAWQMPPSSEHWSLISEIVAQLPAISVSVVSYPLAPKNPAPIAFPQLMRLYKRLLRDAKDAGEEVTLAGDSSGGNLALCMTLAALAEDENSVCPAALMVVSPAVDLRPQDTNDKSVDKHDPILSVPFINWTAETWRGEWDGADPRVTPLNGDLSLLARRGVKVHGIIGRYDVLAPRTIEFCNKCREAGVQGEWLDWDKQMHCFPLAFSFKLPESVAAKDWMLDVLYRN